MTKLLNLSIKNIYSKINNQILPQSIRSCIIDKSSYGKKNLLMNLFLNKFIDKDYNNSFFFQIFTSTRILMVLKIISKKRYFKQELKIIEKENLL